MLNFPFNTLNLYFIRYNYFFYITIIYFFKLKYLYLCTLLNYKINIYIKNFQLRFHMTEKVITSNNMDKVNKFFFFFKHLHIYIYMKKKNIYLSKNQI